jgi:predicted Zn-dependent protease
MLSIVGFVGGICLIILVILLGTLLTAWHMKRFYAAQIDRYRGRSSGQWRPSAASQRIAMQLGRTDGWTNDVARREIQNALVAELAGGQLPPEEEMLVLDSLLTSALVFADAELRPQLDAWSRRAQELGPEVKAVAATRGGVLIELGHYEAGKALLLPAMREPPAANTVFDRLMTQFFLARAEHALGNTAEAEILATAFRQAAEMLAPSNPAVRVLMRRLDEAFAWRGLQRFVRR